MALEIGGGITFGGGITVNTTGGSGPIPSTTFFPLSNTATDPTSATWQANNPGYTFTPYVGITTLTPMTNASEMFYANSTFNDPDVSTWDTSTITDMSYMFLEASTFDQPIGSWNTSSVTNMTNMFNLTAFDQPLNSWNTANVADMSYMFAATPFNQPIGSWNTANVNNMNYMFQGAQAFNQDISSWNTANVTDMNNMFAATSAFNCGQAAGVAHDLMQRTATTGWRVGNVTNMDSMFLVASAFNGNISNWCVSTISTTPTDFATGANVNFTVGRQPTWGACPYPNV